MQVSGCRSMRLRVAVKHLMDVPGTFFHIRVGEPHNLWLPIPRTGITLSGVFLGQKIQAEALVIRNVGDLRAERCTHKKAGRLMVSISPLIPCKGRLLHCLLKM